MLASQGPRQPSRATVSYLVLPKFVFSWRRQVVTCRDVVLQSGADLSAGPSRYPGSILQVLVIHLASDQARIIAMDP